MVSLLPMAALVALKVLAVQAATTTDAKLANIQMPEPDVGSCRMKGIDESSKNFQYYASISAKDYEMNEGCGRCIKVSCTDTSGKCTKDSSVTAFVLDVASGYASGQVKLSKNALDTLGMDVNANGVDATYKFVTCPSDMLSGNVKACLMEGAGASYIPLQLYNSLKVITKVTINGVDAQMRKDSFMFAANPQQAGGDDWYKKITFEATSDDTETRSGTLSFSGKSGCVESDVQFSKASTRDADDSGNAKGGGGGGGSKSTIVIAVVCAVGVIGLVIGSVFVYRRRRAHGSNSNLDENDLGNVPDVESQYLSPKHKTPPPPPVAAPAAAPVRAASPPPAPAPAPAPAMDLEHQQYQVTSPGGRTSTNSYATMTGDSTTSAAVHAAAVAAVGEQQARGFGEMDSPTANYTNVSSPQNSDKSSDTGYPRGDSRNSYSSFISSFMSNDTRLSTQQPSIAAAKPSLSSNSSSPERMPKPAATGSAAQSIDRSSFDIDDMRDTENNRGPPNNLSLASYDDEVMTRSAGESQLYGEYGTSAITSPQSYVQATSFRRNSARQNNASQLSTSSRSMIGNNHRPNTAINNNSSRGYAMQPSQSSSGEVDLDDFTPPPTSAPISGSVPGASAMDGAPGSLSTSQGYSRGSLSILGYPYARRSGRNVNNLPEAEL